MSSDLIKKAKYEGGKFERFANSKSIEVLM